MALNLKDVAGMQRAAQRPEGAQPVQPTARATAKLWETEPWEKTREAAAQERSEEALSPAAAKDAQEPSTPPAVDAGQPGPAPTRDASVKEPSEAQSAGRVPDPSAQAAVDAGRTEPTREAAVRRRTKAYSAEADDVDRGLDDVLGQVEELKLELRNTQKTKRALEDALSTSRSKTEEILARAAEHARAVAHLEQEMGELRAENECQLAELCAADAERSEGALEHRRLVQELKDSNSRARTREEEVVTLRAALESLGNEAEGRERQLKQSGEEHVVRWRKFEAQLNQKDRELFQARASVEELRREKEHLEARLGRLERWRAAFEKVRSSVQEVRERSTDSEPGA